jgi:hypothetical protein
MGSYATTDGIAFFGLAVELAEKVAMNNLLVKGACSSQLFTTP